MQWRPAVSVLGRPGTQTHERSQTWTEALRDDERRSGQCPFKAHDTEMM